MKASEPSITDRCAAVILVGGKSRRMGKDKASLVFDGQTLLEKAVKSFNEYFEHVYVSVREDRDKLPEDCIAITDRFPGCGPLAGLDSAFFNTDKDYIFLCAVDLPFMDAGAAKKILSCLEGYDVCVIKKSNGHVEPLFAAYSRSCHKTSEELLLSGDYKMSHLLERCRTRYISLEKLGIKEETFVNVNTPEEFESAIEQIHRK